MSSRTQPVNFVRAIGLLEDVRDGLHEDHVRVAYREADRILEEVASELGEDLPDEVKQASRDAFAHSGLHGFAMSAMDPKEHHTTAAKKHAAAAIIAKKHGLVKLAHKHQKQFMHHSKTAKNISLDDD